MLICEAEWRLAQITTHRNTSFLFFVFCPLLSFKYTFFIFLFAPSYFFVPLLNRACMLNKQTYLFAINLYKLMGVYPLPFVVSIPRQFVYHVLTYILVKRKRKKMKNVNQKPFSAMI